jgi:UDP-N-acetyl-2-amino-2-deoxyglucuronate dehydrogenase
VKWYRSPAYYNSPVKGSWAGEGGGALINQAIHQVDLLLHLVGDMDEVSAFWQLGAVHRIESEDAVSALLRYACGATGVIQASTAVWPGYPERLEIHGTKGTAIITGDKLTTWDVEGQDGKAVPIIIDAASGASDPMAISVVPFERQLLDFGEACRTGARPSSSGKEGFRALELVQGIYKSCREGRSVNLRADRVRCA